MATVGSPNSLWDKSLCTVYMHYKPGSFPLENPTYFFPLSLLSSLVFPSSLECIWPCSSQTPDSICDSACLLLSEIFWQAPSLSLISSWNQTAVAKMPGCIGASSSWFHSRNTRRRLIWRQDGAEHSVTHTAWNLFSRNSSKAAELNKDSEQCDESEVP